MDGMKTCPRGEVPSIRPNCVYRLNHILQCEVELAPGNEHPPITLRAPTMVRIRSIQSRDVAQISLPPSPPHLAGVLIALNFGHINRIVFCYAAVAYESEVSMR
jgi:hypothetical protein